MNKIGLLFTDFTGKDCSIATVDTGINLSHPLWLGKRKIGVCFKKQNDIIVSCDDIQDHVGHGTAIHHIITQCCPEAMIYTIKVTDSISVDTSSRCVTKEQFEYVESRMINILGKGTSQRLAWINPDYIIDRGSSFACAYISSLVLKLYQNGTVGFRNVLKELKNRSVNYHKKTSSNTSNLRLPFCIHKAILFPYNKEMESLIRFSDLLNFEIVSVYDLKYSAKIGKSVQSKTKLYTIKGIEKIDWDSFDTLILGHVGKISEFGGNGFMIEALIETASRLGKNLFLFDKDLVQYDTHNYYSYIDKGNVPKLQFGKMFDISIPIISILLWLELALEDFYIVNITDKRNGYYGIRGVLTYGHRVGYVKPGLTLGDCYQTSEEQKRKLNNVNIIYSPLEFQMNTAFSKACIIESSGSKLGVSGNSLYIDIDFFEKLTDAINNKTEEAVFLTTDDNYINCEKPCVKYFAKMEYETPKLTVFAAQNDGENYEYLKINFGKDIVDYENEKCNIHTKLYKAINIWSVREPEYIFDLNDFSSFLSLLTFNYHILGYFFDFPLFI